MFPNLLKVPLQAFTDLQNVSSTVDETVNSQTNVTYRYKKSTTWPVFFFLMQTFNWGKGCVFSLEFMEPPLR